MEKLKKFLLSSNQIYKNFKRSGSSTIFSLSSGKPKCGVAVIRVSGSKANDSIKMLTDSDLLPKPRYASLKKLMDPISKEMIDKGLILWFPAPHSFTGEDCCEFQVHGGSAIISSMLEALSKIDGLRPALPGEFTKRAFFSGKLDLTEVEGLADLIHAETEKQRKNALLQTEGHLSKLYHEWKRRLIKNVAHLEAYIDFSEDENIEADVLDHVLTDLKHLHREIEGHLKDGRKGELLKEGVRLVILGDANVGKSSLMNKLCQKEISIVTNIPGTTRDLIETSFDVDGYPVVIVDTAGIRQQSLDIIENEGIIRAKNSAALADILIIVIDATKLVRYFKNRKDSLNVQNFLKDYYLKHLDLSKKVLKGKKVLTVVNKIDLVEPNFKKILEETSISISCTENIGISQFIKQLSNLLEDLCGNPSTESLCVSQTRHRHHLNTCQQNIEDFLKNYSENADLAILVQKLRNSIRSIGYIVGEVRVDDILDVIFKDFCIGK